MPSPAPPTVHRGGSQRTPRNICLEYCQGSCMLGPKCPLIHPSAENIADVLHFLSGRHLPPRDALRHPFDSLEDATRFRPTQAFHRRPPSVSNEICIQFLRGMCAYGASCFRLHITTKSLAVVFGPRLEGSLLLAPDTKSVGGLSASVAAPSYVEISQQPDASPPACDATGTPKVTTPSASISSAFNKPLQKTAAVSKNQPAALKTGTPIATQPLPASPAAVAAGSTRSNGVSKKLPSPTGGTSRATANKGKQKQTCAAPALEAPPPVAIKDTGSKVKPQIADMPKEQLKTGTPLATQPPPASSAAIAAASTSSNGVSSKQSPLPTGGTPRVTANKGKQKQSAAAPLDAMPPVTGKDTGSKQIAEMPKEQPASVNGLQSSAKQVPSKRSSTSAAALAPSTANNKRQNGKLKVSVDAPEVANEMKTNGTSVTSASVAPSKAIQPTVNHPTQVLSPSTQVSSPTTTVSSDSSSETAALVPQYCRDYDRGRCYFPKCRFVHRGVDTESKTTQPSTAADASSRPAGDITVTPAAPQPSGSMHKIVTQVTSVNAAPPRVSHIGPRLQHSIAAQILGDHGMTRRQPPPVNAPPKPSPHVTASATTRPAMPPTRVISPPAPRFLPPKRPPSEEMNVEILDVIRVTFGPGFNVVKLVTGFESLWITLGNVPVDTERGMLERLLAPYGRVVEIRFRDETTTGAKFTLVSVQMGSYTEAVAAIDALDDMEVFGARIRVRSSTGRTGIAQRLQDREVRISWNAPLKVGFAGYETKEAALKAVASADGKILRKYWVTATTYEGLPVVGTFNVRFMGLPADAKENDLKRFGTKGFEGAMFERPNFLAPNFGATAIEKTLQQFGPMESFELSPAPYKDGVVRAWARFESPDVARVVCELNGVKQRALNGEKVYARRMQSLRTLISRDVYAVVDYDMHRLQEKLWQFARGARLVVHDRKPGAEVEVKLVAEDTKTLSQMKAEFSQILRGEVVMERPGVHAWDGFFGHSVGAQFLSKVQVWHPGVLVRSDRDRKTIRVLGPAQKRAPAVSEILGRLQELRSRRVRTIPLAGRLIGLFVNTDLLALQRKHGTDTVWLSLSRRELCVRGDEELYEQVQELVHRVRDRHSAERSQDHCPVCFEEPTTPTTLYCGHTYCKACFSGYLLSAVDNRSFPLKCLGDGVTCAECIPMLIARNVLAPAAFQSVAQAAFQVYVDARPEEFHFCPTTDCPQVYRAGPRDTALACPSCLTRLCPHCHVEYHEGIACADRTHGDDELFAQWVGTHDVKKCPGCQALIERAEGCNHMTCARCKTHTCWECLETFEQGQGIYDHMRNVHGSIGL
ncbi:hypothetical protein FA95DRAFT_1566881 [Auriscalpium vulgare]|uniref:Uncharacterized protein n=1 Tax=Auriscalpium vulgare TaxID=40419 RepID=A0ACB8R6T6_9AGAM|nr:hypothetical protein FA95DRAFT_1566881 [Auriscalpium vulgare]